MSAAAAARRPARGSRGRSATAASTCCSRTAVVAEVGERIEPRRTPRSSTPRGLVRLPGLHRPPRPSARARAGVQGDDRTRAVAAAAGGFTAVCAWPTLRPSTTAARCRELIRSEPRAPRWRAAALSDRRDHEGAEGRGDDGVRRDRRRRRRRVLGRRQAVMRRGCRRAMPTSTSASLEGDRPALRGPDALAAARRCTRAEWSTRLGLRRHSRRSAEDVMVARDMLLAEVTGGRSTSPTSRRREPGLVRRAKARGHRRDLRGHAAPSPPDRRGGRDRGFSTQHQDEAAAALRARTARPCSTALARRHGRLHRERPRAALTPTRRRGVQHGPLRHRGSGDGRLRVPRPSGGRGRLGSPARRSLLDRPARGCSAFRAARSRPGSPADVTLFHPEARWKVDPQRFVSKGRSTPFAGWTWSGVRRDDRRRRRDLAEGRDLVVRDPPPPFRRALLPPAPDRIPGFLAPASPPSPPPIGRSSSRLRRTSPKRRSRIWRRERGRGASKWRSRRRAEPCRGASTSSDSRTFHPRTGFATRSWCSR